MNIRSIIEYMKDIEKHYKGECHLMLHSNCSLGEIVKELKESDILYEIAHSKTKDGREFPSIDIFRSKKSDTDILIYIFPKKS